LGVFIFGVQQEQARCQQLTCFFALALGAFGLQSLFFFLERSTHFENGLAFLALVVTKRHDEILLASRVIGKGSKVDTQ
jgi:hypothetical protein